MVKLTDLPPEKAAALVRLPCPVFDTTPWIVPPPPARCQLAVVSTAGLHRPEDRPFHPGAADFRVIPGRFDPSRLVMTHVSRSFDRTGFREDVNLVFPVDRLREMRDEGEIGGLAPEHYSFMGATDPVAMRPHTRTLAARMREHEVTAVLLVPV